MPAYLIAWCAACRLGHFRLDRRNATRHEDRQHGLQVGAGREGAARCCVGIPDYQALVIALGFGHRLGQAGYHALADHMHLGFQRQDQHLVVLVPEAHRLVLKHRGAGGSAGGRIFAQQRRAECLAPVNRQFQARNKGALGRRPGSGWRVHAALFGHRTFGHPLRQRRIRQRAASRDVFANPVDHLFPAGGLPNFERTQVPAEAPA